MTTLMSLEYDTLCGRFADPWANFSISPSNFLLHMNNPIEPFRDPMVKNVAGRAMLDKLKIVDHGVFVCASYKLIVDFTDPYSGRRRVSVLSPIAQWVTGVYFTLMTSREFVVVYLEDLYAGSIIL